jgi:dipeptidyl aminopeptidase/acylaminoacyl peptidase
MMYRSISSGLIAAAVAAACATGADATLPGTNGQIVFARTPSGNLAPASDLYTVNPDGSGVTRLTVNGGAINPAWSPDGKQIAFENHSQGGATIELIDADGSHATPLVHGFGPPAWSPDASKIAITSDRDGNDEIYEMNANGSGLMNLTQSGGLDYGPAWSPDGMKIAFGTLRSPPSFDAEIYVMNADGSAQTDVTNDPSSTDGAPPSWSPDGTKLAYSVSHDGIYVIGADGSGRTRLTTNPLGDIDPAWSPDGKQIVFARQYAGNCTSPPTPTVGGQCRLLWIMNADGTDQRQLTFNPGGGDTAPSWGSVPPRVEPPENLIGQTKASTPVSAYGGRAAWSAYDPTTKRYSLVTWTDGMSSPEELPVKPRAAPFDVDLGPGARGLVVAVYSRCRREPTGAYDTGRGCDLYLYDFITRRESRIRSTSVPGGSEFLPTIWGSRIAFARVWEQRKRKEGNYSYIYTRVLNRRDRSQRLAGGPFGDWLARRQAGHIVGYRGGPGPTSLDMRGTRLALSWSYLLAHGPQRRRQLSVVQLDPLRGTPRRIVQVTRQKLTDLGVLSASLAADGLYWIEKGETQLTRPDLVDSFRRYDLKSGSISLAPAPESISSAVRDGDAIFYSRAGRAGYLVGRSKPSFETLAP